MSIDVSNYRTAQSTSKPKAENKSMFAWLNQDISLPGRTITDKSRERFYSEFLTLLGAGVDIKTALELLESEEKNSKLKTIYEAIRTAVISGDSLSHALEKTGKFSSYEYYSIRIGEESGRIAEVIKEMSIFYGKKIKLKRQLTSALTYPSFVLCTAIGVVYFMLTFIVPMFSDVFKRFDGELPEITLAVIKLSSWVSDYIYVFLALAGSIIVLIVSQKNALWWRKLSAQILIRIPFFGPLIAKVYIARFCQSMQLLLASKTPLVEALSLVSKMIGFYPIESSLKTVQQRILEGSTLHHALSPYPIYGKRLISLIKVAEEVNQLDTMFDKLARQYSEEVEHKTSTMGSVIEPVMIIFIALFVGLILVAMYLPLFRLSTTIG